MGCVVIAWPATYLRGGGLDVKHCLLVFTRLAAVCTVSTAIIEQNQTSDTSKAIDSLDISLICSPNLQAIVAHDEKPTSACPLDVFFFFAPLCLSMHSSLFHPPSEIMFNLVTRPPLANQQLEQFGGEICMCVISFFPIAYKLIAGASGQDCVFHSSRRGNLTLTTQRSCLQQDCTFTNPLVNQFTLQPLLLDPHIVPLDQGGRKYFSGNYFSRRTILCQTIGLMRVIQM